MKVGRNERCPCGSGKKYKQCHEKLEAEKNVRSSKLGLIGFAAAIALGVGGLAIGFTDTGDGSNAGRVWSAEHQHWHNADGTEVGSTGVRAPTPQPAGEAPPGKVWSTEHGHWHDVAQ
jgi:SEC-C motif